MAKKRRKSPRDLPRALAALEEHGLLLHTDAALPNVCRVIAGERVRGSWWGHPAGSAIYRVAGDLSDHKDVLVVRLLSRKWTYVHRRLWPTVLGVARSGRGWQRAGLSNAASDLKRRVDRRGRALTTDLGGPKRGAVKALGKLARELEDRLLLHAYNVHTESGAHARVLESWSTWAKDARWKGKTDPPAQGRKKLQALVAELNSSHDGKGRLPWE